MAGVIISPSTDRKIKSRDAAMRFKHGSPQFKDILRQRCRQRIKHSRGQLMDKLRSMSLAQDVQQALTDVMRQEMSQIINMQDHAGDDLETLLAQEIDDDPLTDGEAWIMQQYEQLLDNEDALQQLYEESLQVICPICQKGNLAHDNLSNVIGCSLCSMRVPARAPLHEVHAQLFRCVNLHAESGCTELVQFFLSCEVNTSYLYGMCSVCSLFDLIV